jgi:hypothetical protein
MTTGKDMDDLAARLRASSPGDILNNQIDTFNAQLNRAVKLLKAYEFETGVRELNEARCTLEALIESLSAMLQDLDRVLQAGQRCARKLSEEAKRCSCCGGELTTGHAGRYAIRDGKLIPIEQARPEEIREGGVILICENCSDPRG